VRCVIFDGRTADMRVVFFGSGAFGVPTLKQLHANFDVCCVVSQPDRPAGRRRTPGATPISDEALRLGLPLLRMQDINEPANIDRLRAFETDAWVVIAFGQRCSPELLHDRFAINLHASLLPRWRGAAPIHHAVMAGDAQTGVSVITLDRIMDAGLVLGRMGQPIECTDTTGDLHDALANVGPTLVQQVLAKHLNEGLVGQPQDAALVTLAPRLGRADAVIDLSGDADIQRQRINGLSPWPGCRLVVDGVELRLLRAGPADSNSVEPGCLSSSGVLGCGTGALQLLEVQPAGGRAMTFESWANGRRLDAPVVVEVPA